MAKEDREPRRLGTEYLIAQFADLRDRLFHETPRYGEQRADLAAEAVRRVLLPGLGWSGRQLAENSGIPNSQIADWLRGRARLGADEICRVAWAVAGGLDGFVGDARPTGQETKVEKENTREGRSRLDFLMNSLLLLAGYNAVRRLEDVVWRRYFDVPTLRTDHGRAVDVREAGKIQERDVMQPLRVGWFPWSPLISVKNDPVTGNKEWEGPGVTITKYICGILGKRHLESKDERYSIANRNRWTEVRVHFQEVESELRSRAVDIFAPLLMIFPGRYTSCRFSKPIPHLRVKMAFVVRRDQLQRICSDADGLDGELPICELRRGSKIEAVLPPGELSASLCSLVLPDARVMEDPLFGLEPNSSGIVHRKHLMQTLLRDPDDDEVTRVLLTNRPNALWMQKQNSDLVCVTTRELASFSFQVGFAVHPDERRLLDAINAAIDVLDNGGVFHRIIGDAESTLTVGGVDVHWESRADGRFDKKAAEPRVRSLSA